MNIGLRNYTDCKLTDYYTKQEPNSAINNINLTKQNSLIVLYEVGDGSYRVIAHADFSNSDIVRSIAGVGPISITGNINPDYGEITDLQIGLNLNLTGLTNYSTRQESDNKLTNYYTKQDIDSNIAAVNQFHIAGRVNGSGTPLVAFSHGK